MLSTAPAQFQEQSGVEEGVDRFLGELGIWGGGSPPVAAWRLGMGVIMDFITYVPPYVFLASLGGSYSEFSDYSDFHAFGRPSNLRKTGPCCRNNVALYKTHTWTRERPRPLPRVESGPRSAGAVPAGPPSDRLPPVSAPSSRPSCDRPAPPPAPALRPVSARSAARAGPCAAACVAWASGRPRHSRPSTPPAQSRRPCSKCPCAAGRHRSPPPPEPSRGVPPSPPAGGAAPAPGRGWPDSSPARPRRSESSRWTPAGQCCDAVCAHPSPEACRGGPAAAQPHPAEYTEVQTLGPDAVHQSAAGGQPVSQRMFRRQQGGPVAALLGRVGRVQAHLTQLLHRALDLHGREGLPGHLRRAAGKPSGTSAGRRKGKTEVPGQLRQPLRAEAAHSSPRVLRHSSRRHSSRANSARESEGLPSSLRNHCPVRRPTRTSVVLHDQLSMCY